MTPAQRLLSRKTKAQRFKPARLLRIFIFSVAAVLLVSLLGKTFLSWRNQVWLLGARLTLVVGQAPPKVLTYDPQTKTVVQFVIPANTSLSASADFGLLFAGRLWEFGEQKGMAGAILASSVSRNFGIPVDAWVKDDKGFFGKTNLTIFDRARLFLALRTAKKTGIDLVKNRVVVAQKFPDGEEGFVVVPEEATSVLGDVFRDEKVFAESKTLAIINGSGKTGLATNVAKIAQSMGVRVISVSDAPQPDEECLVRGAEADINSFSAQRLARLFSCRIVQGEAEAASLELVLGPGFAKRF